MGTTESDTVQSLLVGRWSCRAFLDRPVERPLIARVLELAALSPSWCNTQPWQVLVTGPEQTEDLRAALAAHLREDDRLLPDFPFPERYEGVLQERRRACGWQLYDAVGVARGDRVASARQAGRNAEFFGAPHVAIVSTHRDLGTYGAVDCGVYLSSFLLAAQSLGVGAVPQAAVASYAPFLRSYFGLDESRLVVFGISFGFPDLDHPANGFRTPRASLDETVTWVW